MIKSHQVGSKKHNRVNKTEVPSVPWFVALKRKIRHKISYPVCLQIEYDKLKHELKKIETEQG